MDKKYWNHIFYSWFKIPKKNKLLYYRNPKDCCTFHNGNINYDNRFINEDSFIWGIRNKKQHKGSNYIKIAKLYSGIPIVNVWMDKIIYYVNHAFDNLGIAMFMYYIFIALLLYAIILNIPIWGGIVCLRR